MTSLVGLATKDALVLGCDSLGTTSTNLIDPLDLIDFFDSKEGHKLRMDKDGKPLLKDFRTVYEKAKSVPYTHMTHMSKLFSLSPLEMGIMSTGVASIGNRTTKSLIEEFRATEPLFRTHPRPSNYTVKGVSRRILKFILESYESEYPDETRRPYLEFILGGYDKRGQIPRIARIKLPEKRVEETLENGDFGIVFGGEMKEIQRIVFGTDWSNRQRIRSRHIELLKRHRDKMNGYLSRKKIAVQIPQLSEQEAQGLDMFSGGWDIEGFHANWGDFSEQNAIECVDFFVSIMIKSQQFSQGMPTVGGEVHIALVTKARGFRFISREEYYHGGRFVPKETGNR